MVYGWDNVYISWEGEREVEEPMVAIHYASTHISYGLMGITASARGKGRGSLGATASRPKE